MAVQLKNLPTYDPVNNKPYVIGIDENNVTVDFLHLGLDDSNKSRLLRCKTQNGSISLSNSGRAHYDGCTGDIYLNNETNGYLSLFDSATRNCLSSTSIKVKDETDSTIYEIARRCFLLSYTEYGFDDTGAEGASILGVLKVWKNTTNANTARTTESDNGATPFYYLRTPASTVRFYGAFSGNGTKDSSHISNPQGSRPCLSFDPETYVTDPDENNHCFLLPDPTKLYREAGIENFVLGTQTNMPTQAKIFLTAKGCMTNYPEVEITANFDDSTPVWLPVTMIAGTTDSDGYTSYTGLVDFSGVTASQGVKFAVNIYARTQTQCRIAQPVIAPA